MCLGVRLIRCPPISSPLCVAKTMLHLALVSVWACPRLSHPLSIRTHTLQGRVQNSKNSEREVRVLAGGRAGGLLDRRVDGRIMSSSAGAAPNSTPSDPSSRTVPTESVQRDWEERELTESIQLGVTQLMKFLNDFGEPPTPGCKQAARLAPLYSRSNEHTLHELFANSAVCPVSHNR